MPIKLSILFRIGNAVHDIAMAIIFIALCRFVLIDSVCRHGNGRRYPDPAAGQRPYSHGKFRNYSGYFTNTSNRDRGRHHGLSPGRFMRYP